MILNNFSIYAFSLKTKFAGVIEEFLSSSKEGWGTLKRMVKYWNKIFQSQTSVNIRYIEL